MTHQHVFNAVERTLQDLQSTSDKPFGGHPVIFGGTSTDPSSAEIVAA